MKIFRVTFFEEPASGRGETGDRKPETGRPVAVEDGRRETGDGKSHSFVCLPKPWRRRLYRPAIVSLSLIAYLSLAGCAKVGEPLPPLKPLGSVQDLRIRPSGASYELEFSLPEGEVSVVEVLLACGKADPPPDDYRLSARIDRRRLLPAPGPGRYSIVTSRQAGSPCYYLVRFEDPAGRKSEPSNAVRAP